MALRIKNTYPVHGVPKDNVLPVLLAPDVFQEAAFRTKKSDYEVSTVEPDHDIEDRITSVVNKLLAENAKKLQEKDEEFAERLERDRERSKKEREAELNTLRKEREAEMKTLRKEREAEMKTLRKEREAEMSKCRAHIDRLEAKIESMQEEFTTYVTDLENIDKQKKQALAKVKLLKTPTNLGSKPRHKSPVKLSVFSSANIH